MACRLDGAKPLFEPMLEYCLWDPKERTSVKSDRKSNIFIYENALENVVCEMASILSRSQCDNWAKDDMSYMEPDTHTRRQPLSW